MSLSKQVLPTHHYRAGPLSPALSRSMVGPSRTTAQETPDQCIFIHYYKMKRRWGLLKEPMRAGAGYDQLPPPENSGSEGPAMASYDIGTNEPEEVSVPEGAMVSLTQ